MAPTLATSARDWKYTNLLLAQIKMLKLTHNDDTKQNDTGGDSPIRIADFQSLTLPLFASDGDMEVNNSSCEQEKLTQSAPIFVSESRAIKPIASSTAAFVATATRSK
jgi:hypothetical protein